MVVHDFEYMSLAYIADESLTGNFEQIQKKANWFATIQNEISEHFGHYPMFVLELIPKNIYTPPPRKKTLIIP